MNEIDWENGPFTEKDFYLDGLEKTTIVLHPKHIAYFANKRFRELLEQAPTVYGIKSTKDCDFTHWCKQRDCQLLSETDNVSAKLVAIKKISTKITVTSVRGVCGQRFCEGCRK